VIWNRAAVCSGSYGFHLIHGVYHGIEDRHAGNETADAEDEPAIISAEFSLNYEADVEPNEGGNEADTKQCRRCSLVLSDPLCTQREGVDAYTKNTGFDILLTCSDMLHARWKADI
jgi:hypothetical protein